MYFNVTIFAIIFAFSISLRPSVSAQDSTSTNEPAYDSTKYHFHKGLYHLDEGAFKRASKFLERAKYFFNRSNRQSSMLWSVLLRYLGEAYYRMGSMKEALQCFEIALEYIHETTNPDPDITQFVLSVLGELHSLNRDYQKAKQYQEEQLALLERHKSLHSIIPYALMNLGISHYHMESYRKSLQLYRKAESELLTHAPDDQHGFADLYNNMAAAYRMKNELDSCLLYLNKERAIRTADDALRDHLLAKLYTDLGEFFHLSGDPDSAEFHFISAINLARDVQAPMNLNVHYYMKYVRFLREEGRFQEALNCLDEAKSKVCIQYMDTIVTSEPVSYILMLREEADIRINYFDQSPDSTQLLAAFDVLKEAIRRIREHYIYATTARIHRHQTEVFYPVYELFLHLLSSYDLSLPISAEEKHELAFSMMEQSRNLQLFENINAREAERLARIPDSLLERRKQLIRRIKTARSKFIEAANAPKLAAKYRSVQLKQEDEYHKFLRTLYRNYPQYYQLVFPDQQLSLFQLQDQMLLKRDLFIEFFMGKEYAFALRVSPEHSSLVCLGNSDSLRASIDTLDILIRRYPHLNDSRIGYEQYLQALADIANGLFESTLDILLPKDIDRLIIVPDGHLHRVPFESLLTGSPSNVFDFCTWPYVVRAYQVAYQYSAALWKEMTENTFEPAGKNVLFASNFNRDTSIQPIGFAEPLHVHPLPSAPMELKMLNQVLDAVVIRESVTKEQFSNILPGSDIAHLATHTVLNDQYPSHSVLIFDNEHPLTAQCLYLSELLNMDLPAQLVTLNTCSTHRGPYTPGQGLASLSKGFAHAGARSIIATRWPTPDRSGTPLLHHAYLDIVKGKTKLEALSNAKQRTLTSCDPDQSHPYYWANYLLIGNTEAITKADNPNMKLICFLLIMMVLLIGWKIGRNWIKKTGRSTSETTSYNKL